MGNFHTAQKRASRLTPDKVVRDTFDFIRTLERELAQYNRARLNLDSKDIHGDPIGFYSIGTEKITKGRKVEGQPFDLFETGEFLRLLKAKVERDNVLFDSLDPKKPKVFENLLSEDIFGLSDEDLTTVISEKILPWMLPYFKRQMI